VGAGPRTETPSARPAIRFHPRRTLVSIYDCATVVIFGGWDNQTNDPSSF
jgi:hypothetical protein